MYTTKIVSNLAKCIRNRVSICVFCRVASNNAAKIFKNMCLVFYDAGRNIMLVLDMHHSDCCTSDMFM